MRGNPILRAAFLLAALCLAGVLLATVVGKSPPQPPAPETQAAAPTETALVPTLLTITLSAPFSTLRFVEQNGRTIKIAAPPSGELTLEHEVDLTVHHSTWNANLEVEWQDPSRHNFLRLDLEPESLKSTTLNLDFRPQATAKSISTNLSPSHRTPNTEH